MLTVWRHYAARFLRAFAAALAILALLLIAVDAMLHLSSLLDDASSPVQGLRRLAERALAAYAEFLIPAAAFVGAFWCAGSATLHHETLALKASAISPLVAFAPLLALAGSLAALHFAAVEAVGVKAAARLAAARNPSGGDVRVRAGDVWYHAGRVVYSARGVDPRSGALSTVHVYERDELGRLVRTIQAARAERLAPQRWAFDEALVREFDPERIADAPRERREQRALLELPSDRSPRLRRDELAGLPRDALRNYIAAHQATGADASDARIVLHNRLSGPFAVIAFAALAIPLALRSEERRSLARAALQAAALFVAYLLARDMGSSFAAQSPELAFAFPWLTLGALGVLGVVLLARAKT
ncbi:MAG TPA: LptF/LptG family permease [Myxococcota bacterium]|nr:LptF/LptG family permease [Myxococcota bacterium]